MEPMKLPGPKARALIKRDSAVISPSYPRGVPFVMDHGRGTEVWDVDGNEFFDFSAGIAVTSTGVLLISRGDGGIAGWNNGSTATGNQIADRDLEIPVVIRFRTQQVAPTGVYASAVRFI